VAFFFTIRFKFIITAGSNLNALVSCVFVKLESDGYNNKAQSIESEAQKSISS